MNLVRRSFWLLLCIAACLTPRLGVADDSYDKQVKPLLRARCFACHGALKQEAGLRLDTALFMREGGDSGAALEPGSAEESLILDRVSAADESERMPPEGEALTSDEIAGLRQWIQSGAIGPADEQPEDDPREHWAFQAPQATTIARAHSELNNRNAIDVLLNANRNKQSLRTVETVERSLLLRRVYLDLIGVPPTRAQLHAFLEDDSPDAYERVVDRLLASPRYGERWGRHWMDVWRYSDWYGLGKQLRNSQKHIWRWRDWIVESLNDDTGYDEMIRLMLAADELRPEDQESLRATGYLARNYYLFNRTTWLDSTIEHTSKSLLGLTVNCAKCHDHKYDAISQNDYYAMRAIFEPHQVRLDPVAGETDLEKDGLPRVFDAHPDATTYVHVRGDEKSPDKSREITPNVLEVVLADAFKPTAVKLPAVAVQPALLPFVRNDRLAAAHRAIAAAATELKKARATLEKAKQLAAKKTTPSDSPDSKPGVIFSSEEFDKEPDATKWAFVGGEWNIRDGKLVQSQDGASRASLQSKANHPRDFHAVVEFTTIGGSKWRSVGLCFDTSASDETMVYMSSVQPGSKLQVSHKLKGQQQYPEAGRVARAVKINTPYKLEIRIRDRLLNVSINGQPALAYVMPRPRQAGKLQMVAFDAQVHFERLWVSSLAPDAKLVMVKGATGSGLTLPQAEANVQLLDKKLAAAKLFPAAIETALEAERANQNGENADAAKNAATTAHLTWQLAAAEVELASAQMEAEKKSRDQKVAAAQKKIAQMRKQREQGDGAQLPLHVSLKALEGPAETDASRRRAFPPTSTGRRTALATWITDRRNPLTARVAVNHVWARHFGQPLVDPVDDFGRRTAAPTQQAVLDHLAVEFMEHGWRFKDLHRLIVTSHTYQLSTSTRNADARAATIDGDNHYYWRRLPRRMESELVRDSLLHLAGSIDWREGGPSVKPQGQVAATGRRSMYFTHSRDDQHAFLAMFDNADILRCYRRSESIVPQQALTLANSRLSLEAARQIAAAMIEQGESPTDSGGFVVAAFETILSRAPSEDEAAACLEVLDQLRSASPKDNGDEREQRARANLIHALINHNDFVTIR